MNNKIGQKPNTEFRPNPEKPLFKKKSVLGGYRAPFELRTKPPTASREKGMRVNKLGKAELVHTTEAQEMDEMRYAFASVAVPAAAPRPVGWREEDVELEVLGPNKFMALTRTLVPGAALAGSKFRDETITFTDFMGYQDLDFPHGGKWQEAHQLKTTETKEAAKAFDGVATFITVQEMREAIPYLEPGISQEELNALCSNADIDGDGTIDYHEFIAMLN